MKASTPWQRYASDLQREGFTADPAQRRVVEHTQRLYDQLTSVTPPPSGWLARLLPARNRNTVKGLYLWGGVGRGKTYLVDCFFDCLPLQAKLRIHFHSFMQMVHRELRALTDTVDPLDRVAQRIAERARVLCFDEFHVSDITDAMLLGNLLKALFARGVVLVATSNEAPARLYWNGLQRDRFLPAIKLIEMHTEVVHVDSDTDYRLRALERAEIYHSPLDEAAESGLARSFAELAPEPGQPGQVLEIEGRPVRSVRHADGVVWFDFSEICGGPRGAADYIELARCYQTVLIGGIPVFTATDDDCAKRFMTLVDEFYDRNVKLIVSAAVAPEALYEGERLTAPFQRTISRLQEMRTHEYLARQHLSD